MRIFHLLLLFCFIYISSSSNAQKNLKEVKKGSLTENKSIKDSEKSIKSQKKSFRRKKGRGSKKKEKRIDKKDRKEKRSRKKQWKKGNVKKGSKKDRSRIRSPSKKYKVNGKSKNERKAQKKNFRKKKFDKRNNKKMKNKKKERKRRRKDKKRKDKKKRTKKKKGKGSRKRKNTRNEKRRKGQKISPILRQDNSCKNVTCLNTMLQVMKIKKDQVKNFLKQNIRITKKLALAGNKGSKSSNVNSSISSLASSLGGESALSNNRAVCHGKYNITEANEGSELYNNMAKCDSNIKNACKVSLGADVISELLSCEKTMMSFKYDIFLFWYHTFIVFRNKSEECLLNPSDCSCWNDISGSIKDVQKCNIGKN